MPSHAASNKGRRAQSHRTPEPRKRRIADDYAVALVSRVAVLISMAVERSSSIQPGHLALVFGLPAVSAELWRSRSDRSASVNQTTFVRFRGTTDTPLARNIPSMVSNVSARVLGNESSKFTWLVPI